MPNGVNGITDADVRDRLRIAVALVKEAKRARQQAMALAQEATKDDQEVSDIIDGIFKKALEGGGTDVTMDEILRILGAAVNGALETRRAAEKVNLSILHPGGPGALNVQMMLTSAARDFQNGDLYQAYSKAGVAIRGCEDAIAAIDAVKTAERAVDRAVSDAKALGQ